MTMGERINDAISCPLRTAESHAQPGGRACESKIIRCTSGFVIDVPSYGPADSRCIVATLDELLGIVRTEFTSSWEAVL